jgi:hypothetical protein
MLTETRHFIEKGWNYNGLADSCWEMFWNAVRQPLVTAKSQGYRKAQRLLESLWTILKGYRKAPGKCLNTLCQPKGEEAELPSRIGKNVAIYFPLKH